MGILPHVRGKLHAVLAGYSFPYNIDKISRF